MNTIENILAKSDHRPFELPSEKWMLYQNWRNVLFLHLPVEASLISDILGQQLSIDIFYKSAWLSLVIFDSCDNRLRFSQNIPVLPDFTECNLRTYVTYDNKPGVYFLDILGSKLINNWLISAFSKLKYKNAKMISRPSSRYRVYAAKRQQLIDVYYMPGEIIKEKSDFEHWLTERYCCYTISGNKIYRYDILHLEWLLQNVQLEYCNIHYPFANKTIINEDINLCHFAKNSKALLWRRKEV